MKCLQCDGDRFEKKKMRFTPEVKGEFVAVLVLTHVCTACNTPLMDSHQMNHLRKAAADQYRRMHGLLTSDEIIKFRQALGMSQAAFANYLKVGEASVKRWETYYVQDVVQDENIRLKCDESYAETNALEVHWKIHPADIYSGKRRFNWELFKQAACYLVELTRSPLFLNKALFYLDFIHYKLHGTSITGARYVHLEYGPCPDQYQNLFDLLIQQGILTATSHHELKSAKKADLSVFDDAEKETLRKVTDLVKNDQGKALLEQSHEEQAFKKTHSMQLISYDFAKHLKI
jgi:putative zinc finger/helix-turn-helix YgiT family protein